MEFFNTNFETILMRYYLMMTIVIASFMLGVPYLSVLAVPVFLTALLGLKFTGNPGNKEKQLQQHHSLHAEKAA